jgi:hypothetical protein
MNESRFSKQIRSISEDFKLAKFRQRSIPSSIAISTPEQARKERLPISSVSTTTASTEYRKMNL